MQGKPWVPKDSNADRAEGRADKNGELVARHGDKNGELVARHGELADAQALPRDPGK